jgi:hypothetical protein
MRRTLLATTCLLFLSAYTASHRTAAVTPEIDEPPGRMRLRPGRATVASQASKPLCRLRIPIGGPHIRSMSRVWYGLPWRAGS